MADETHTLESIERACHPLVDYDDDYGPLLEQIGDARIVLLGEATHGTSEFYRSRAEITRRLVTEKNFNCVAVEADWPDAYRINRYVRQESDDSSAREALEDFERFPTWMWRNTEVMDFVEWLRTLNDSRGPEDDIGFYGLDLYSLHRSMNAVVDYLERIDPEAAERARDRYACFDHYDTSPQAYGRRASLEIDDDCRREVVEQLAELRSEAARYLTRDGLMDRDEQFFAEQNARVAQNAEEYYRTMFEGDQNSWNVRDRHMFETLEYLLEYETSRHGEAKIVIWEHNSHLGNASATQMSRRGEINVGQLVEEAYGEDAFSVGYTTYDGTVSAASDWGGPVERKAVRPATDGSYEQLFHRVEPENFILPLQSGEVYDALGTNRLERAIGVIYRPQTERVSHYFQARLSHQFDAVIHFDHSRAVTPLELTQRWEQGEWPDTFPSSL